MDFWKDIPDLRNYGASDFLNHRTLKPFDTDNQSELQKHNEAINEMIKPTLRIPGVFIRYDNMETLAIENSKVYQEEYKYANDYKYYYRLFAKLPNGQYYGANFKTDLDHVQLKRYFDVHDVIALSNGNEVNHFSKFEINKICSANILSEDEYNSALNLIK